MIESGLITEADMLNIPIVENYKYLGVWVDGSGDLSYHLKHIILKRSKYLATKMRFYA